MIKVLVEEKISGEAIDYLIKNGIEVKFGSGLDEASIIKDIQDCSAVVVRLIEINKNVIDSAPKLRLIAKHGVGCDSIDTKYAKQKGIAVLNTPGANSQSVAEHTVALILSCAHKIVVGNTICHKGEYMSKDQLNIVDLEGKTVGLIGCGKIGQKVAKILYYGFQVNVIAYDPFLKNNLSYNFIKMTGDIYSLLANSDFVSLHLPLSDENRHLMSKKEFSKMKSTAYLINTARGELVDNDALLEAINEGRIAGAGLDTTSPEPLDDSSGLLSNQNIIITPHSAALSAESFKNTGLSCAKNIVAFFNKS